MSMEAGFKLEVFKTFDISTEKTNWFYSVRYNVVQFNFKGLMGLQKTVSICGFTFRSFYSNKNHYVGWHNKASDKTILDKYEASNLKDRFSRTKTNRPKTNEEILKEIEEEDNG